MVELASRGCLPGLGIFHNTALGFLTTRTTSKKSQQVLHYHLKHREDWKSTGGLLDRNQLAAIGSRWPEVIYMQLKLGIDPGSLVFSFGIAEQCIRQEKITKLLALIEKEDGLLHLSLLSDLMGSQQQIMDPPQLPFAAYPTWCFNDAESEQSLVYPMSKLYFNEPLLDFGENGSRCTEIAYSPDRQVMYNSIGSEMKDILSVIADFYVSKDGNKPSECAMVVPYFEWRRRVQSSTDSLKLTTEKADPLKSHENETGKARQKRKMSNRTSKKREIYDNSYVQACESLLSIIVDRKQQGKNAILSVKRACPQLPQLLVQSSATIAGAGIAVVLSVACKITCGKASLCASKALSAGLGLGLAWLSLGIIKLRNTIISIARSWGKMGSTGKENEMMDRLDGNLKDIYFRAVVLVAVVVLRLA